ncbi:MAG: DUF1049 domain-containing protein [Zetaproteobacteria bacterium CG12_big_fil_rev_8_21_14_0_65_54_13]|nr:MAG: hypothetical protein COX55_05170 [Zetaproteobacteria bacterium CG23_combo_of_CG06-09_8_20_14_all_54_7]PIW47393.1 MAG: DUF1049 domain-containing protein [Zetaproteobacteria bacterium CG12_big_fil_rev_8_21_14_0_65_54_13]PIX55168.1 MAG: DUF1049 domain-containing protein [Zetaproteobacteria bacterium CG_4_10_14_3_um_filter_54_28]PJA30042.1 MAG: DUF1049 domain-containing protein [Zetaproteobacteria bacterium CG_4_9_14_3_um_filter_54_145]
MHVKLFSILGLIALAVIFIVQNTDVVALRVLFWEIDMSRSLMFLFLLLIGMVAGWFLRAHMLHQSDHDARTDDRR